MFLKDTFRSGQIVLPVPVGIPVTLQYNIKGILERIFLGFDNYEDEISYDMFNSFYNSKVGPVKINVTGGTTWVKGVLYCDDLISDNGDLPQSILCKLSYNFTEHPETFKLFAGTVESKAIRLSNFASINRWLSISGFNILPHFIVPTPLDSNSFDTLLNHNYPFLNYYIMCYMIYDKNGISIVYTGINEYVVDKIQRYTDVFGNIKCNVSYHIDDENKKISYDYSTVVKLDIMKNKCVICDKNMNALICFGDSKRHLDDMVDCEFCGRQLKVPSQGTLHCSDPHCKSNRYSIFLHFIRTYHLPELSFSRYKKESTLYNIVDLFDIDPWSNYTISTNFSELLRSIIPVNVVSDKSLIDSFVSHCNGNVNMFHYYISNTHAIQEDFHLSGRQLGNFIKWLSDNHNKEELIYLLDCKNICINDNGKRFKGYPIFRNKTIMITGDFNHGSQDDIVSILKSYSAEVVNKFDENVDCVIIGSTLSNMNSIELNKAKISGIPVFEENEFFHTYEIDNDIQENLH